VVPFINKVGLNFLKDRYNIVLFFWETNVIPPDRLKLFAYFNEVWVTTRYNQECLSPLLSIPVTLIPHPLQLNYTPSKPDKASFGLKDKFTFLFCFDFFSVFQRKNPIAIINAFQSAFGQKDDVQLVIKSHNGQHHPRSLNPALQQIKGDSRITWIDESMDQQRRYDLINACDCYVSLHRSEGFGLTMAEAMLLEKPVIATGYSGNLDFMTPKNSFLCGYKLIPVGPNHHPYPSDGVWADVNVDEAASFMKYVVNHAADAKKIALQGKQDILCNHSFASVGISMTQRLQKIASDWDINSIRARQRNLRANFLVDILAYYAGGIWRKSKKLVKNALYRLSYEQR
jgi:glycosyltransferase involved in cell wall biosynthesis